MDLAVRGGCGLNVGAGRSLRQMCRELLSDRVGDRRVLVGKAREPGTQRAFTRRTHFAADRIVVMQVERAQERLERAAPGSPACRARPRTPSARSDRDTGSADGSASAAASETMPRMPAHEMIKPLPTVGRSIGRGGWKPNRRCCHLMTALNDMCQASRTTITVSEDRAGDGEVSAPVRRFQAARGSAESAGR